MTVLVPAAGISIHVGDVRERLADLPLPWAQLALFAPVPVRTMIERVPSNRRVASELQRYKRLADEGWDVTALLAPDVKTVVLMACRPDPDVAQLALLGKEPA